MNRANRTSYYVSSSFLFLLNLSSWWFWLMKRENGWKNQTFYPGRFCGVGLSYIFEIIYTTTWKHKLSRMKIQTVSYVYHIKSVGNRCRRVIIGHLKLEIFHWRFVFWIERYVPVGTSAFLSQLLHKCTPSSWWCVDEDLVK